MSTPITSGRRFADWSNSRATELDLSHFETYQEFLREVLEPNSKNARTAIQKLRTRFNQSLIDPTALKDIDGWTQDDYRCLWAQVIERYAGTVIFLNGWQYSNGCAYEFFVANQITPQRLILKESLETLTLQEGTRLVKEAVIEFQNSKTAHDFLEQIFNELTRLQRREILAEA